MRLILGFLLFFALVLNVQAQQNTCGTCHQGVNACIHTSDWFCNNCKVKYKTFNGVTNPVCPNINCRSKAGQWRETNHWNLPQGGGNPQNSPWNQPPQQVRQPQIVKPTKSGKSPWEH